MRLLGPWLLLLVPEYLAFSDSNKWTFKHPPTLYAWEGACIWIPCFYKIPRPKELLESYTLYHNAAYNDTTKNYSGTILITNTKPGESPSQQGRVRFLGNKNNNCTLSIHPVQAQDSGQLGLRMMTKNDKWMENIHLNVSKRPFPPHIYLPSEIWESREVTLICLLNFTCFGYQIQLQWSLEGNPVTLTSLSTENVFTRSELKFQPQWSHHGKNLTCRLWSDVDERVLSEETVQLDIKHSPKLDIEVSPREATVMEGESVTMSCEITSSNPEYQTTSWLKDGLPLREKTLTLTLSPVDKEMSGKYRCEASNDVGRGTSKEVTLEVWYSPKSVTTVIQNPTPIREGDSVTLSCNYNSSNPRVTRYEWSPKGSWNEPSPGVLMIQKIDWDIKTITCAACNNWCSWASPVNLNVQYAPRDVRILKISPHSEIRSGDRVLLQCDFSSSHPGEVHFFWKRNGSLLGAGKELRFDSVTPEDAGHYSCSVNNSIGQTASQVWMLQVLYAPRRLRVSMNPGDRIMEGKKAALTCESDANPPVSQYNWFDWNNQNLHHGGQTLRLEPVKVQHSGAYRCQGTNWLGMGESPPSTLTVYYSPETIGRRAALGIGICLAVLILAVWGLKLQRSWKRTQSQQGLQENSSGQSFFVRNNKVRRAPLSEGPHSLGCYNPVMEDAISYAALRFPETDTPRTGDAETSEMQGAPPNGDNTVTYSTVQKRRVGDYENVAPNIPEDEGIHYSELIQFGVGERPRAQEDVEYVTLKH
ncbi:B-cell receptor CD22 isoform X2 [Carlito syrichta]|uniref:B-cell receptor CD22 n=1 Tax=Carlito syrichta TaxID=1868482 RepID=A0A1U7TAZ2_CARSF|nr:B-cell receptor CD22 isoform X2 [Carlito syrichta]